jgi:hypothetical protein
LSDHRFHRYDLVKEQLATENPIVPVLERVARVLRSGHRVWLVGNIPMPQPNQPPPADLPPAPRSAYAWDEEYYSYVWGLQLSDLLLRNAAEFGMENVGDAGCISPYENLSLQVAAGKKAP